MSALPNPLVTPLPIANTDRWAGLGIGLVIDVEGDISGDDPILDLPLGDSRGIAITATPWEQVAPASVALKVYSADGQTVLYTDQEDVDVLDQTSGQYTVQLIVPSETSSALAQGYYPYTCTCIDAAGVETDTLVASYAWAHSPLPQ